jgi:hypothetical protein
MIERLLYDDIYKRIIGYQDLGHSHELEVVRRIYDAYFPENKISIEVAYVRDQPYILTITFSYNHKERYTKTFNGTGYDKVIDCKQWLNQRLYVKNQTFDVEEQWLETPN